MSAVAISVPCPVSTNDNLVAGIDVGAFFDDDEEYIAAVDAIADASAPADDPKRIQLLDGPALASDDPPLEYIVPVLGMTAGSGAPHLFAGYGYSGKTMLAQGLALSVAAGRGAWGGMTCLHGRVAHVDLEQGARLTKRRYKRLAHALGVELAELGDRLVVAARPELVLHEAHRTQWLAIMTGRDLLIVDSWRAACPGVDENSSEVRASLDMLGSLSEATGCRALVIHHARKPSDSAPSGTKYSIRGSSGFYDGCDAVFVFSAQKGEPVLITCEKAREHGDDVDDATVEIVDVAGSFGPKSGLAFKLFGAERLTALRAERSAASEEQAVRTLRPRVVAAVARASASGAPLTSAEAIRVTVRAMKSTVTAAIQSAIEAGEIHRAKSGRSTEFRPGRAPIASPDSPDSCRTISDSSPVTMMPDSDSLPRESSPSSAPKSGSEE